MMRNVFKGFVLLGLMGACSPQQVADQAVTNMARDVVMPVVSRDMPAGPAALASDCILRAADITEIRALARDYGVEAGSQTKENIRNIALRPAAQSCFAASGVPSLR